MNSLEKVLQLVSKTGMPAIILRENQEEPFVILSQKEYEELLDVKKDMETFVSIAEERISSSVDQSNPIPVVNVVDTSSDYYFSSSNSETVQPEEFFVSKNEVIEVPDELSSLKHKLTSESMEEELLPPLSDIDKELLPLTQNGIVDESTVSNPEGVSPKKDDSWSSTKNILASRYAGKPEAIVTTKENTYKENRRKQYIKKRKKRLNSAVFYDEPI